MQRVRLILAALSWLLFLQPERAAPVLLISAPALATTIGIRWETAEGTSLRVRLK